MENNQITFLAPLAIYLPRKTMKDKRIALSLNEYRNLNFRVEAQVKIAFTELMRQQLTGKKFSHPSFTWKLYYKDKRRHDKLNFVSIISKYFLDAMVHYDCIVDDSDHFVGTDYILEPEIDKHNPRCEITITDSVNPNPTQGSLISIS